MSCVAEIIESTPTRGAILITERADLEWTLDHSRREFLVRRSRLDDHDAIKCGAVDHEMCITVTRLRDGRRWIFSEFSTRFPQRHRGQLRGFENTDAHARARLGARAYE